MARVRSDHRGEAVREASFSWLSKEGKDSDRYGRGTTSTKVHGYGDMEGLGELTLEFGWSGSEVCAT